MKKRLLSLTIVGLLGFSAIALSACDSKDPATTPASTPVASTPVASTPAPIVVSTLAITNKEALQADWAVGQDNRLIELTADGKEFNVSQALANKDLTITSSNTETIVAVGAYIIAKGIGKSTITVTYGGKTDTVEVEALKRDSYPTFVAGTLADVVADTNGELVHVVSATVGSTSDAGTKVKVGSEEYDIATLTADVSKLAYDIENTDAKPTVQSYSLAADAAAVTGLVADDVLNIAAINEGGTIKGILLAKNGKGVVHADVTTDDIFNKTLDAGILGACNKSIYYRVTGVITQWQYANSKDGGKYGNVTIKTEGCENSVLIYGCTVTETALSFSDTTGTFAFKNPQDFLTNEQTKALAIGDTITLEGFRASDYNGVAQMNGLITNIVKAAA